MKYLSLISFLFISGMLAAQKNGEPTNEFTITGDVKNTIPVFPKGECTVYSPLGRQCCYL